MSGEFDPRQKIEIQKVMVKKGGDGYVPEEGFDKEEKQRRAELAARIAAKLKSGSSISQKEQLTPQEAAKATSEATGISEEQAKEAMSEGEETTFREEGTPKTDD